MTDKNLEACGFSAAGTIDDEGNLVPYGEYHPSTCPYYKVGSYTYFKVGAYGTDDLEYELFNDGSVRLPETNEIFLDLDSAYKFHNEKWIKEELSQSK